MLTFLDESNKHSVKNCQMGTKSTLCNRGKWTIKQKKIMLDHFKEHVGNKISPKKNECLEFKDKHKNQFEDKTWLQIKVFIYNTYRNN